MEVDRVLYARRSIRKFKEDPVNLELVGCLLKAAVAAPSWKNSQTPRFLVIDDKSIISNFADTACSGFRSQNILNACPCVIVVCSEAELCGKGCKTRDGKIPEWFMFDAALSVENLVLSAADHGLGSLIIGGCDLDKVKSSLSIPDQLIPVCIVALGYADEAPEMPQRKAVNDVAWHNTFEEKF